MFSSTRTCPTKIAEMLTLKNHVAECAKLLRNECENYPFNNLMLKLVFQNLKDLPGNIF